MKTELHPRNRHRGFYDFKLLIKHCSRLAQFVAPNEYGNESIDFANPMAVKTLNKALLKTYYNIEWDLPAPFLCPPIPNRADYIHTIADILQGAKGKQISILDIGVGANCIYPLIGHREYGWRFVGTDINPQAISIAKGIVAQNGLQDAIEIRQQKSTSKIFEGISEDRTFDISMCNPPFHSSQEQANAGTKRKWKNLHKNTSLLNFGGQSNELWCPGGEVAFIHQMIQESIHVKCTWFTSLVSKEDSLSPIYRALQKVKPTQIKTINLGQGQKKSRIIAWTFS
jgi:23S rRNA (adenine1618-N6)-methyltransferase